MLTVSKNFGNQPAIDNFDLNKVLGDVSNTATKSKNIIDAIRTQVQDVISPRAYTAQPIPPTAPVATTTSISPMWIVIGLVAVIIVVFIIKK